MYDDDYRENKSHLRYYLWPTKKGIFIDYLAWKEAQHARNLRLTCTKPNKPTMHGGIAVDGNGKFVFNFDHAHNYNDKYYEILEYSHYDNNEWVIAPCWSQRKDDW
jgi:hypothetical protein